MKKLFAALAGVALAALLVGQIFAAPAPAVYTPPPAPAQTNDAAETDFLALVNAAHPVNGRPGQLVPAYPAVPVRETGVTLHAEALDALKAMFDAAKQDGMEGLYLSSGYRTYDEQKQIYEHERDKSLVQPPGHSEHHTGLAADILALGVGMDAMGSSRQGRWLAQNAWRFGFILRYPEGKQAVTGIAYEPWHFRYIGPEHARHCYENNLCLEEYLQK